ncbi:MAG: hypothetical protein RR614_12630, partial [Eubacterium sp.]
MKKRKWIAVFIGLVLFFSSSDVFAEGNAGSATGRPIETRQAQYYSDQCMWKVSLYVAKSDQVDKETGKDMDRGQNAANFLNNFYKIGSKPIYLMPNNGSFGVHPLWGNTQYNNGDKISYMYNYQTTGGHPGGVNFVGQGSTYLTYFPNVPYAPQFCDGDWDDDFVPEVSWAVGDINTVKNYFDHQDTINRVINYYASKEAGGNASNLTKNLTFTIDGETRSNWNWNGIRPAVYNGNPSNQIEWLLVYEPVNLVYTRDKANCYALTATEFAISQMTGQIDWWYNITWDVGGGYTFPEWAPYQQYAFGGDGYRQHYARAAYGLVPNSVFLLNDWYGFNTGTYAHMDLSAIPGGRWQPPESLLGGGWGMSRYVKPQKTTEPHNYE